MGNNPTPPPSAQSLHGAAPGARWIDPSDSRRLTGELLPNGLGNRPLPPGTGPSSFPKAANAGA